MELTVPYQEQKLEFIKNPVVVELLGFSSDTSFTESDLEQNILSNLQKFMMELYFVLIQRRMLPDILFYMVMSSCFMINTNYICPQRKNFGQRLKHRS